MSFLSNLSAYMSESNTTNIILNPSENKYSMIESLNEFCHHKCEIKDDISNQVILKVGQYSIPATCLVCSNLEKKDMSIELTIEKAINVLDK